jgi:hypothetical protein
MNQLEKMLTNMESDLKNHEETRQLLRTLSEDPDRIKDGEKMRELAVRARFNYCQSRLKMAANSNENCRLKNAACLR